jgi:hypothetical protein
VYVQIGYTVSVEAAAIAVLRVTGGAMDAAGLKKAEEVGALILANLIIARAAELASVTASDVTEANTALCNIATVSQSSVNAIEALFNVASNVMLQTLDDKQFDSVKQTMVWPLAAVGAQGSRSGESIRITTPAFQILVTASEKGKPSKLAHTYTNAHTQAHAHPHRHMPRAHTHAHTHT